MKKMYCKSLLIFNFFLSTLFSRFIFAAEGNGTEQLQSASSSLPDLASLEQSDPVKVSLLACLMIERRTGQRVVYDYDRSVAAIDLAVQYSNNFLMPPGFNLTTFYVDIGSKCSPKPHITGYAMNLRYSGILCDVYIGPGKRRQLCLKV